MAQPTQPPAPNTSHMHELPGTEYSRYLVPIEYLPSRSFQPRWGYGLAPQRGLYELFAGNDDRYVEIIKGVRDLRPLLSKIPRDFVHENLPTPAWLGVPISPVDTALLYYFVCRNKPRTYLEVGSGVTTCFARRSVVDNKLATRIISIDPEPRAEVDNICDEVIRAGLEECDLGVFDSLEPGDIVFVDGSHRSFMNSDVTVFMLDVLPNLKPGVLVHFHDILLPYDYPDSFKYWYWNEQYLLAAYLLGAKPRIEIVFPSCYVTTEPQFKTQFDQPFADVGLDQAGWYGGGSMWLTHTA